MGRGMKKWAPYKTLTEQYEKLYELRKEKQKIEKPKISSDRAEEINEILVNYSGEELVLTVYKNGEIFCITSPIYKIDINNKCLICKDNIKIQINNLINIERL